MSLGVIANRVVLVDGDTAVDLERASDGRFPADPEQLFDDWDGLVEWAETPSPTANGYPSTSCETRSRRRAKSSVSAPNPTSRLPQQRRDHDIEGDHS